MNYVLDATKMSYFKTSNSLTVRWGLLSPVLVPGVDSPDDIKERSFTPLVIVVESDPAPSGLELNVALIASALRIED